MSADIHKEGQPPTEPDRTDNDSIFGVNKTKLMMVGTAVIAILIIYLLLNNNDDNGGKETDDSDNDDGGGGEAEHEEEDEEEPIVIEKDPSDPLKDDEKILEHMVE